MAPTALLLLAPGAEEVEAVTVINYLRRGGVTVTVAGVKDDQVIVGSNKIKITPDLSLASVKDQTFDAVILPGGMGGFTCICEDQTCKEVVLRHHQAKKIVAAICAAPVALFKFGVITSEPFTCYPSMSSQCPGTKFEDKKVVVSGNVITSQGPSTAVDFALELIKVLVGAEAMQTVRNQILYK